MYIYTRKWDHLKSNISSPWRWDMRMPDSSKHSRIAVCVVMGERMSTIKQHYLTTAQSILTSHNTTPLPPHQFKACLLGNFIAGVLQKWKPRG